MIESNSPIRKIGILTSGGDSPGMNAAIRAVVRTANFNGIETVGVMYGYQGLIDNHIMQLGKKDVAGILQRGGTVLKTARCFEFMEKAGREKAFNTFQENNLDALVVIGGDGSLQGAHIFSTEFGVRCVGLPGTIDNDLEGTNYTIGFDTATNTAIEAIDKIRDTADALDRIFVIEVMGKNSGYIAMYSGLTTGAGCILLPEKEMDEAGIAQTLREFGERRKKTVHLIVVAEGFHISAEKVTQMVKTELPNYDTRMCVLGHIQRGGSPTYFDRLIASRLAYGAVQTLHRGEHGVMLGIINNRLNKIPLENVFKQRHTIANDFFDMINVLAS